MAIFNSYVSLPEGIWVNIPNHGEIMATSPFSIVTKSARPARLSNRPERYFVLPREVQNGRVSFLERCGGWLICRNMGRDGGDHQQNNGFMKHGDLMGYS